MRPNALQHRLSAKRSHWSERCQDILKEPPKSSSPRQLCVGMVRDLYPMAADLAAHPTLARDVEALRPASLG
ncbi:MAG: hypothetical protein R3E79_00490 [Caldilineaceae bacterium]